MPNLEELMKLPGALAAFNISDRGELSEHLLADTDAIDVTTLDMVGHICVANTSIATMQARGWEKLTGMEGFYPVSSFTMIGIDWSVVTCCNTGVIMENDKADFQAANDILNR